MPRSTGQNESLFPNIECRQCGRYFPLALDLAVIISFVVLVVPCTAVGCDQDCSHDDVYGNEFVLA